MQTLLIKRVENCDYEFSDDEVDSPEYKKRIAAYDLADNPAEQIKSCKTAFCSL